MADLHQARAILEGPLADIEAAAAFQQLAGGQQCTPPLLTSMQPSVRAHVSRAIRHALMALTSSPWRPISEPPSAEVHAWCGGFFLFRHVDGGFTWQWERPGSKPQLFADMARNGWALWLPIPPSDERRG